MALVLPRPSENLPRGPPYVAWSPSEATLSHNPRMRAATIPTKHNGQQQPSTRSWPPGLGLRYQCAYFGFGPSSPASQAHCTPACPPRAPTRYLNPDCSHFTVYMDQTPLGVLVCLHSTIPRRTCTATQAPPLGPCRGRREVSSCLCSPETCRHWREAAHRDASQGAGLPTTRRQLKHSLGFLRGRSAWDP